MTESAKLQNPNPNKENKGNFWDKNKGSPPQAAGYSLLKQNCLF